MGKYFVQAYNGEPVCIVEPLGGGKLVMHPMIEGNGGYDAYLEWLAAGNTPEPWNPEQENN